MFRLLYSVVRRLRGLVQGASRRLSAPPSAVDRAGLERLVGAPLNEPALYEQALRHRSLLRNRPDSALASNERLEFLGDAVLGFVTAEHLYHTFPDKDEGFLTRLRAKLVNGQALARAARAIDLGPHILMSDNMAQADGRTNPSILADAYEAVIGAVYLDLGVEPARAFIHRTLLEAVDIRALARQRSNFKSLLLEHAQGRGWPQPKYRVTAEEGPSHDKTFTVEVVLRGTAYGTGTAGSKKKAEQLAASEALDRLRAGDGLDDA